MSPPQMQPRRRCHCDRRERQDANAARRSPEAGAENGSGQYGILCRQPATSLCWTTALIATPLKLMKDGRFDGHSIRTAAAGCLFRIVEHEAGLRGRFRKIDGHAFEKQAALRRQKQLHAIDFDDRIALLRRRFDTELRGKAGASPGRDRKPEPAPGAPSKRSRRCMNFSAGGVTVRSIP